MSLISEKDQKLIDFIRSHLRLPDWSLAMAIRGFLELEKMRSHRERFKKTDRKEVK